MDIPYGRSNFEEIRRRGYFYVDKTPYLPILERGSMGYPLLLRPRRFGKSTFLSLLETYYDIGPRRSAPAPRRPLLRPGGGGEVASQVAVRLPRACRTALEMGCFGRIASRHVSCCSPGTRAGTALPPAGAKDLVHKLLVAAAGLLSGVAAFLSPAPARALQQPDGAVIPAPPGCNGGQTTGLAAELACVCVEPGLCNQGAACPGGSPSCDPGTNGTCETTTWHDVNDNPCIPSNLSGIDPQADAKITPETFHPTCPQTFTVLSRGTAMFKNAFGWYNVTGQAPAIQDLHLMLDCDAGEGTAVVLDLKAEPDYAGGDVGFFLVTPESHAQKGTCDGGDCCATLERAANGQGYVYFSEREHNPDFVGASSWIHLLLYESQVFPSKYYFAWEDSNKSPNNDFTDLLTSVSGIQCSGAGLACDTGQEGVCGAGITQCQNGELSCLPLFTSGAEECNGLDDDCDGAADDGATCPNDYLCHHGACIEPCVGGEFPCPGALTCDEATGLCVDEGCIGVTCPGGEVCREGQCEAPCSGVVCPHGQSCIADVCVDLCGGVACGAGEVCRAGKCFAGCAACDGISCEGATKCDVPTGACLDPSCPEGCPEDTYCSQGQCKGLCDGVKCPGQQVCVDGQCVFGEIGGGGMGGFGGDGGGASGPGGGGDGGGGDDAGGGGPNNPLSGKPACACRTVGGPADTSGGADPALLVGLGALAAALGRRSRRTRDERPVAGSTGVAR